MVLQQNLSPSRLQIRYNRLIKELADNSDDCEWSMHQVAQYHDQWLSLQNDISDYAHKNDTDPENLQIWQNTASFCQIFEHLIELNAKHDSIFFNFSETTCEELADTKVDSFGADYEKTPAFFDVKDRWTAKFRDSEDDEDYDEEED